MQIIQFTATKQRNCQKGYSCGATCISKTRNCGKRLSPGAKSALDYLSAHSDRSTKKFAPAKQQEEGQAISSPAKKKLDKVAATNKSKKGQPSLETIGSLEADPSDYKSLIALGDKVFEAYATKIPTAEALMVAEHKGNLKWLEHQAANAPDPGEKRMARAKLEWTQTTIASLEGQPQEMDGVDFDRLLADMRIANTAKGAETTVAIGATSKSKEKAMVGVVDELDGIVGDIVPYGVSVYNIKPEAGERSHALTEKDNPEINLVNSDFDDPIVLTTTMFHEYGHHIEVAVPGVVKASQDWIRSRATSKKPVPLGGGYGKGESAYPDKFVDPYVGKDYGDATEVISVGMEYLTSAIDARELYRKDPEHMKFLLGVLLHERNKSKK